MEELVGTVDAGSRFWPVPRVEAAQETLPPLCTYHPQPTFVSSALYFCHVDADAHGCDFTRRDRHGLLFHAFPGKSCLEADRTIPPSWRSSPVFGSSERAARWMHDGMILGSRTVRTSAGEVRTLREAGAAICGVWARTGKASVSRISESS